MRKTAFVRRTARRLTILDGLLRPDILLLASRYNQWPAYVTSRLLSETDGIREILRSQVEELDAIASLPAELQGRSWQPRIVRHAHEYLSSACYRYETNDYIDFLNTLQLRCSEKQLGTSAIHIALLLRLHDLLVAPLKDAKAPAAVTRL